MALAFGDWVDEQFALPPPSVPRYEGADPETAAQAIRAEWGLGEQPIRNLVHLLEAHGIRVFSLVEECRELDAFSFWRGSQPYVFLNTLKSAEHSRMDVAHELGHLVLHWKGSARGRDAEFEAQLFGSALLMPRASLIASAPRHGQLAEIIQAKHRWNVSVTALTYRMHKLGLLTEWEYRSHFVTISRLGYRTIEPEPSKSETSQVWAKVFQMLRQDGVTKARISDQLGLPADEIDKTVFGLVLTALEGGH